MFISKYIGNHHEIHSTKYQWINKEVRDEYEYGKEEEYKEVMHQVGFRPEPYLTQNQTYFQNDGFGFGSNMLVGSGSDFN